MVQYVANVSNMQIYAIFFKYAIKILTIISESYDSDNNSSPQVIYDSKKKK